LEALSKKDLAEIKSFTRPPPKVEMVMEAVMILKNSEPTWAEAKRQLSDVNFINTVSDNAAIVCDKSILLVSQTNSV
jgi:dynein heavy chain